MHGLSISKSRFVLELRIKISSFVAAWKYSLFFALLTVGHRDTTYAQIVATSGPVPLSKFTLEQKVGQLMVWSYAGTEFSTELQRNLTKYQPGGLIVFRRNITSPMQIAGLNLSLQRLANGHFRAPLLLMIDQEGGLVTRLRTSIPSPSALALARMEDNKFVEDYGRATGEMLAGMGFNMNLAPVLDIADPEEDSFIGNRAFGDDPEKVSSVTGAYSSGLSSAGVIPAAKHFPGHGGTLADSHQTVPKKMSTLEELNYRDFIPFRDFARLSFVKSVMMAHMALPNVDSSGLPATYSKILIQDQLRSTLGFDGPVITDDLEMSGAEVKGDIGERAVSAFLAGNDLLILAGSQVHQHRAYEAVLSAVKTGRIPMSRLDESVNRIVKLKQKLQPFARVEEKRLQAQLKKMNQLSREVLKRNFKIAEETAKRDWPETGKLTRARIFSASPMFFQKFQSRFKGRSLFYPLSPTTLARTENELKNTGNDLVVFFASGHQTAQWLNHLPVEVKGKLIVLNCNHPGLIESQEDFRSVLNLNSYFTDSAVWLAESLNNAHQDTRTPAGSEE